MTCLFSTQITRWDDCSEKNQRLALISALRRLTASANRANIIFKTFYFKRCANLISRDLNLSFFAKKWASNSSSTLANPRVSANAFPIPKFGRSTSETFRWLAKMKHHHHQHHQRHRRHHQPAPAPTPLSHPHSTTPAPHYKPPPHDRPAPPRPRSHRVPAPRALRPGKLPRQDPSRRRPRRTPHRL